jgi:hypothetical protein
MQIQAASKLIFLGIFLGSDAALQLQKFLFFLKIRIKRRKRVISV